MNPRDDLISTVAFALRFKAPHAKWSDGEIRLAAEAIVAHLELCRYVIRHDRALFPGRGYFPGWAEGVMVFSQPKGTNRWRTT
jgi:hypothetical protein